MFWGNNPHIVRLPVKAEGPSTKETCLIKWGGIGDIAGHNQYFMVLIYVFRVAKNRIRKEMGLKVTVCNKLSSKSEGSDINEDGDFDNGSILMGRVSID